MTETIKQFLVSLSFGIDEAALSKFNKALTSATLKVTALAVAVKVAAAGIFYGISKVSESFEQLGYELRLVAPALTKTLQLRQAMMYAYRQAGIDIAKAAQQSILFNFSLAKTKFALEAIYKSVALRFIPLLTGQMNTFRKNLYANMPKIQAGLERFVRVIFKLFEGLIHLGGTAFSILGRIYDFFVQLDKMTNGWSTAILAVVAAWKFLNLSFLATPLGMLLTGLVALLALFDDFKTYKEGGQSFFNWSKAEPTINAAIKTFTSLFEVLKSIWGIFKSIYDLVLAIFSLDFSRISQSFGKLLSAVTSSFGKIKTLGGDLGNLGGEAFKAVSSFFPSSEVMPTSVQNVNQNPLGTDSAKGSLTNQKVSQETSIIVQGSADANSTGKAVASEQSRVNFDMSRNLKGATR